MSQHEAKSQNLKRRSFDQWPVASPGLRLAAQIIDQSLVVFGISLFLLTFFPLKTWSKEWWLMIAFAWPLFSLSTQCLFVYFTGTTPGKKAFGLKVLNAKPSERLGVWQVMARQTLWWLGALTLGAGWSTIFTRNDRRAWHDVVSESLVVITNGLPLKENPGRSKSEKVLGHSWAVLVSLAFFTVLSVVMVFQFKRLSSAQVVVQASSSVLLPGIEEASWLLLTDQLGQTALKFETPDDQKIAEHLLLFSQGMKLPETERYSFYRQKMQASEDTICLGVKTEGNYCQSARLASALMSDVETKVGEKAFPALQILYKTEHAKDFEEKSQIIIDVLGKTPPNTSGYLALKSLLVKSLSIKGDFMRALDYVIFEKLPVTNNIVTEIIAGKYYEHACEAAAFAKCDVASALYCYDNSFWKSWSTGCGTVEKSLLFDNASRLGFAWQKQMTQPMADGEWFEFKQSLRNPTDKEKEILAALDFSAALKKDAPVELLEKSKILGKSNILWGWAQTQAIKEYGNQWLAVVPKADQVQASVYALGEKKPGREVASSKKKKSKVKKKKNKKKSSGQA